MSNILCYDSQGKYLKRLYQWDTNQTITISGLDEAPFPIFHFTKDVDGEALVVNPSITSTVNGISIYGRGTPDSATYDASEHNGEKYLDLNNGYVYSSNGTSWSRYKENGVDVVLNSTDTVRVSVPNVLLQTSGTLYVYMVELTDANGDTNYEGIKTTHLIKIPVNARPKPADYEYEENIDYESVAILSTKLSTLIANLSNADSPSVVAEVIDMRSSVSGAAYDTAGEYIRAIDTRLTAAETAIESKANSSDVTAALALKANTSEFNDTARATTVITGNLTTLSTLNTARDNDRIYTYLLAPGTLFPHQSPAYPVKVLCINGAQIIIGGDGYIYSRYYNPTTDTWSSITCPLKDLTRVKALIASGQTVALEDNTDYSGSDINSVTFTYPQGDFECYITLAFASSGSISVVFPTSAYIGETPTFANGEKWEISVKNGVIVAGKVV